MSRVSQALLVESHDMFWIIFEGADLFPQMLFFLSHSPVSVLVQSDECASLPMKCSRLPYHGDRKL